MLSQDQAKRRVSGLGFVFAMVLVLVFIIPPGYAEATPTMVNGYYVLKGQFHTHTTYSDGVYTPSQVVDFYKEQGFDVIAITDHGSWSGNPEAQAEGDKVGLIVVPGEEVGIDTESLSFIHIIALFTSRSVQKECTGDAAHSPQHCFETIHSVGGLGIVAHAYMRWEYWEPFLTNRTGYIDGWELCNPHEELSDSAKSTVISSGYIYTGVHDFHTGHDADFSTSLYQILFCTSRDVSGVREALTSRRTVVVHGSSVYGTSQARELYNSIPNPTPSGGSGGGSSHKRREAKEETEETKPSIPEEVFVTSVNADPFLVMAGVIAVLYAFSLIICLLVAKLIAELF